MQRRYTWEGHGFTLRRAAVALAIIVLLALPLLAGVIADGSPLAGFAAGFLRPFSHGLHVVVCLGVGLGGRYLERRRLALLPLAFLLMLHTGAWIDFSTAAAGLRRFLILANVVAFGGIVGISRPPLRAVLLVLIAALGFHLGGDYASQIAGVAAQPAYLLGATLAAGLLIGIGAAMTLLFDGPARQWWKDRAKQKREDNPLQNWRLL